MNFRNYGTDHNPTWDAMSVKPPQGNANAATLVSQSSIYSLTFDELQNTIGGSGKDFGSMNMDELLKNIWTAEETQGLASSSVGGGGEGQNLNGNLQRQGSLTLPRTLSQKKVDEVWKDLIKENGGTKDGSVNSGSSLPQTQRQPTLGEVTLEEFLVRAGVVREDVVPMPQQIGRPNNNGWFNTTTNLLGFQQPNQNNGNLGDRNMVEGNNLAPKHLPLPSLNSNHSQRQTQHQHQHQPPPLFPKPTNVAFTTPIHLLNNAQLGNNGRRGGMMGVHEHSMNGTLVQSNAAVPGVGMPGLATTTNVNAPGVSPGGKMSPDVITKRNVDPSSLSPVPYVINRGRKCGQVERVVERRQRRMIKNRESAARSRARKQAYTIELEAEVAKLKELNEELQRKQEEFMELQKNKDLDREQTNKRQYLRRTLTGPW